MINSLALEKIEKALSSGKANMRFDGEELTISTGLVERQWSWTGKGWLTSSLKDLASGKNWPLVESARETDWELPGIKGQADLVSVTARESDDEGFTSTHLEVTSTIHYPEDGLMLQYVIWAYSDAAGLRTQLRLKKENGDLIVSGKFPELRIDEGSDLEITDLDQGKNYFLGFSLSSGGESAVVCLSSIDGEDKEIMNAKAQQPVAIPSSLYPGGGLKVSIENNDAEQNLSEAWLYEIGADDENSQRINDDRIQHIRNIAPKNSKVAAYVNCVNKDINSPEQAIVMGITENLPIDLRNTQLKAIGYYSETQQRNSNESPLLKVADIVNGYGSNDWASILKVQKDRDCIICVKESHKCVNTPEGGADTGDYVWGAKGVQVSGLGWNMADVGGDQYYSCWANWVILASGAEEELDLTMKQWDRTRYPIDPLRDLYIMANTWGSTNNKRDAQIAAREDNILVEIDSQQDLGIDVQQIDDGWQGEGYSQWRPIEQGPLSPENEAYSLYQSKQYPIYPEGWEKVKKHAAEKGVKLGLWAAWTIPAEDLLWNYDHGGFKYYKIDFAHLGDMAKVQELMEKARKLILHSQHQARINWDVTERAPRVGYFFGREYGNIYLENRKPEKPESAVYKPHIVLRDAWEVAQHINLNKFQITVQNVDRVDQKASNAYLYPHDYCVAISLMSSPIFFQETHYYSEEARKQIRPLVKVYKQHREEMFRGFVFPIGNLPNDCSWTGFQNYNQDSNTGYLTAFRELNNSQDSYCFKLKFIRNQKLRLTNLLTDEVEEKQLDEQGGLILEIAKFADFRFYRYEIV